MHHYPYPPTDEPIDPDVDLHVAEQRKELAAHPGLLAAIAVGGALGSAARYGVGVWLPHDLPWATLTVNVVGCLLIGVLIVAISEVWAVHRLARPFLGVGVLSGFTTFSTYANEVRALVARGSLGTGVGYLVLTVAAALAAVTLGVTAARWGLPRLRRRCGA